jgi:hypothetical protein
MPLTSNCARAAADQVLVVADWTLDPHAVIASLSACEAERPTVWSLLVPAWLHGLDWAGDPRASGPCAERILLTLRELDVAAGLEVRLAIVCDPHPITAVNDAGFRCDAMLLCTRHRPPLTRTCLTWPTACSPAPACR